MPSFKVPCPSCEHQVLITDPKVVGTKVECPKCKYRFKVEEPAGGIPKDDPKADKGKGGKDKADKGKDKKKTESVGADGKKKKKSKKLVAAVVGILAIGVLAVVGFAMMGGDDKPKPKGGGGGGFVNKGGNPDPVEGDDKKDDKDKDKDKKDDKDKKVTPPVEPQRKLFAASDKDDRATTNLLPNETVSVYRFDADKLRQSPIALLFDKVTQDMFATSFGFEVGDVSTYYQAYVGATRDPFGIIRLRIPVAATDGLPKVVYGEKPLKIKNRSLLTCKGNPFVNGVASSWIFDSLFADFLDRSQSSLAKPPIPRTYGVAVLDSQHVIVGDHGLLKKYLETLDEKGFPTFLSVVGTQPMGSTAQIAELPLYLSIDPKLKRVLQDVGSESTSPPPIIYAERMVAGTYNPKQLKPDYQPVAVVLDPILNRTRFVAGCLNAFNPKGLSAMFRIVMDSESTATEVVKEHLTPGLTTAVVAMTLFLNTPVEFRDINSPGMPMIPGGGFPSDGDPDGRPGGGRPGGGRPQGPGSLGPPPGGGSLGPPPTGPGGGSLGPPPGGGSLGPPPIGPGQPPIGPGQPPIGPGTQPPKTPGAQLPSYLNLGLTDQNITITVELNWSEETYRRIVAPRLVGFANTVKGKMAVFASELSYHALSAAVPKMTDTTKQFPRGTADRKLGDASRMGLKYKPDHRISFFAELLPYMNRGALAVGIDRDAAWYEGSNLTTAEGWVPELLVPLYPQSSWRATSPNVPDGRVLGGTSYVGIAGIGLDAGRYNPKNAEQAKLVGIAGYDWGSKLEEVKDGLDKTIYLMQTPPGLQQPWLAGGGATIRGLHPTDPMHGFRHSYGTPDGKLGTFALMGDGSVRFIPGDIEPKKLLAMATRDGGEDLSDIDKHTKLIYSPAKKKDAELKSGPKADPAPEPREKK